MTTAAPLVGLTTYREPARWGVWDQSADLLPSSYARAVELGLTPRVPGTPPELVCPPAHRGVLSAACPGLLSIVVTVVSGSVWCLVLVFAAFAWIIRVVRRMQVRERLEVAPDISEDDLRALALASGGVVKALDGRDVKLVVVRAPKLVNVVPA